MNTMTQREYTEQMLKKYGPNSMAGLTLGEVADLYEQIDDLTARVVNAEIKTTPSPLRLTRAEIDARAVRLWGEIDAAPRVIISGGEVLEIDQPATSTGADEVYPF